MRLIRGFHGRESRAAVALGAFAGYQREPSHTVQAMVGLRTADAASCRKGCGAALFTHMEGEEVDLEGA